MFEIREFNLEVQQQDDMKLSHSPHAFRSCENNQTPQALASWSFNFFTNSSFQNSRDRAVVQKLRLRAAEAGGVLDRLVRWVVQKLSFHADKACGV